MGLRSKGWLIKSRQSLLARLSTTLERREREHKEDVDERLKNIYLFFSFNEGYLSMFKY